MSFEHFTKTFTKDKLNEENASRDILVAFEQDYPKVMNEAYLQEILDTLKRKRNNM